MQKVEISPSLITWQYVLVLGLIVRVAILVIIFFYPIPYGPTPPISPLHYQTGVDLPEYLERIYLFSSLEGFTTLLNVYRDLLLYQIYPDIRPVGPVYPLILAFTGYSEDSTLGLSLLIFALEAISFAMWVVMRKQDLYGIGGAAFALMPHIIWFGILVSSDIFSYFLGTLFFLSIYKRFHLISSLSVLCFILVMTRPTGLVFCLAALTLPSSTFYDVKDKKLLVVAMIILAIIMTTYYMPYFLVDQALIDASPELREISRLDSSPFTFVSKFFDIFGFHESVSGLRIAELVRFVFGIFFVAGFIYLVLEDPWLRWPLMVLVMFLFLFHVPSWRYLLPFLPILYIAGLSQIRKLGNALRA